MNVSFNPLTLCNFRCSFCYLTEEQLRSQRYCPANVYESRLKEISEPIEMVDIYGGEIGLLPAPELDRLIDISLHYSEQPVNLITNLSKIHPSFLRDDIELSVSFDFNCREKSHQVLDNILMLERPIHILMLASDGLIHQDVEHMISFFNTIANIKTVEIKPYSSNQANQHNISFFQYEQFIRKWIEDPAPKAFSFINEHNIQRSIDKTYNTWSDDHIYIMPNGKFAVLEFDVDDNEFFLELYGYEDYADWSDKEKFRVMENPICGNCSHLGHCLSEHLRKVTSPAVSCNGFRHLIDWYANSL